MERRRNQNPVPRPGDVDRQVLSGDFACHLFHGRLLELFGTVLVPVHFGVQFNDPQQAVSQRRIIFADQARQLAAVLRCQTHRKLHHGMKVSNPATAR